MTQEGGAAGARVSQEAASGVLIAALGILSGQRTGRVAPWDEPLPYRRSVPVPTI